MNNEDLFSTAKEVDIFASLSEAEKYESQILADIAMAIHKKRMRLGMSQLEFASFLGVSQSIVSRWESGDNNFSLLNLSKIFEKLDLRIEIKEEQQNEIITNNIWVTKRPSPQFIEYVASQSPRTMSREGYLCKAM